jgi:murein DD-endopeptidase MepM/ murein hydrolase activator NlpD
MRNHVEPSRSRALSRVAILALIAAGAAGCSSDVSRFNESPFAARKAPPQSEVTGSVQPAPAPVSRVEAQPLPAPGGPQRTIAAGSPGMGSYPPPAPEVTGSVQRPTVISPPPAPRIASPAPAPQGVHVIAPGETIYSVARHYKKSPGEIAKANKLTLAHKVRVGDRLVIPGVSVAPRTAAPAQPQAPAKQIVAAKPDAPAVKHTPTIANPRVTAPPKVAANDAPPTARVITPAADPVETTQVAETTGATPSFRWPVRGRIIRHFGGKAEGQQNDGINLAVPEGTQVKAAEGGTVAYAGNELKGYGNLILLRHANGFVTAYAHASELTVKKGEIVKRGQVIAKAGATGHVTSPQLHFEIRKGATPVDPITYLSD